MEIKAAGAAPAPAPSHALGVRSRERRTENVPGMHIPMISSQKYEITVER